jgi:hypothetical protein
MIYLIIYSYKKEIHTKLLDYVQIFIILSSSARFSNNMGIFLKNLYVIKPDTHITMITIGFLFNLLILFSLRKLIIKMSKKHIENPKIKKSVKLILIIPEVIILVTFSIYIFIQLTPSKKYIYPIVKKSYSYPFIKSFYIKFLNDDFLRVMLDSDSDAQNYEKVYKSFKKIIN